ncbi:hypothetical protein BJV74DRAFT_887197 [Russula compacta]|nr:hypothetical protein BJV74DRAFT_887197 [Russula compacta]
MPLSIGLEFETVVLSLKPAAVIPKSSDAQLQVIADAISATGVKAKVYIPTSTRSSPNYTLWNVVVDSTVQEVTSHSDPSDSAFQSRFGVELVSPTYYETDKSRLEVGMSASQAIDTLHPGHRNFDNDNIVSNRSNAVLKNLALAQIYARILGVANIAGLSGLLNYVDGSGSDQELYDGYSDSKFYKVNFTSLTKHPTVEFRQHEGTVSATSGISWAEFIIRFVEYAINASDDAVKTGGETIDDLARLVPLH